jgi:glycosyltransferase involved in cell wall biosynthesis
MRQIVTTSVALCTYNGVKYLRDQLESYLAQTRLPDELVICDDDSQDGTIGIVEDFAARRAPFPVRIQRNPQNIGSTRNFEQAISLCSGEIIFLSDQDDVWLPDKIEKMAAEFDKSPEAGMVFCDVEFVDNSLASLGRMHSTHSFNEMERERIICGDLFPLLLRRDVVIGAAMAFRSRYKPYVIPIPTDIPSMIHDGWITTMIAVMSKSVYLDEALVMYRQHEGQQTGIDNYVPVVRRLKWKEAWEAVSAYHWKRRSKVDQLKRNLVSRAEIPEEIETIINEEIEREEGYWRHCEFRKSLSRSRLKRIGPVCRELFDGAYHHYSNGMRSAMRDLVVNHKREMPVHEVVYRRLAG